VQHQWPVARVQVVEEVQEAGQLIHYLYQMEHLLEYQQMEVVQM
jgi:hypothetical protein